MRIRNLTIDRFKSLVGFRLDLERFTCLIGLNGAGKSTVLQCVDFLAQQVRGDIDGWLKERNWRPRDLNSHLTSRKIIDDSGHPFGSWQGSFNATKLYCTTEQLSVGGTGLDAQEGAYTVYDMSP